ncbi:MAG: AMP-binding protein, partial [Gemmatimonadetes bacterium]|nr:AMP-binding protein [Gemmatimonadota bacterium]
MTDPLRFLPFPKAAVEQSLIERFEAQAERHPSRLAVKSPTDSRSYAALDHERLRIAHQILNERGDCEEPVVVLLQQGVGLIAAILGALTAGKIYVPLDVDAPGGSLRPFLDDCGAPLILTDQATLPLAQELAEGKLAVLNVQAATDTAAEPISLNLAPGRGAYIFYTSGSTGAPKGVLDTHRNVLHNVMRYTNSLEITPADRLSLVQGASFSGSVSNVFTALGNGASVFPFDLRRNGDAELGAWVERERLTIFHSVPVIFERLVGRGCRYPRLRIVRLEGDRATAKHVSLFQRHFSPNTRLVNGLGATETGLVRQYWMDSRTELPGDAVPIGYPVEDMEVSILDDEGRVADAGSVGEIAIRSRYLAAGYWRRPDLTSEKFESVPGDAETRVYRTGDLGVLAADGCLTYIGRKHFDGKVWGRRVDFAAIENELRSLEGVEDCVVALVERGPRANELVAYLTRDESTGPSVSAMRRILVARFPGQPVPTRYLSLESLPTDQHGKIDRRKLPLPGDERPRLDEEYVAPRDHMERAVAACFSTVLGISKVGVHDDFHDLGGDSVRAVEAAVLLESRLATRIPSELFFASCTVARVAEHIRLELRSPNLVVLSPEASRPPVFLVHNYSGLVLEYRALAAGLGDLQGVYGVQFNGEPESYTTSARLAELAAHYVREIRSVRPRGPYYLAGQCFGGLVAFEVAQQLRASDETVALLVLIDTACPVGRVGRLAHHFSLTRQVRRLARLSLRDGAADLRKRLRSGVRFAAGTAARAAYARFGGRPPRFLQRPTDIHRLAESRYRVRKYDGDIV